MFKGLAGGGEPLSICVAVNIPKAMYDIPDDDATSKGQLLNFEILIKFEPFLRKLLFLLDAQKLREITEAHRGLAAVINALHLNPNRINLQSTTGNDRRSYEEYDYQLLKVYTLRNVEAHEMEFGEIVNLQAILRVFLSFT